MVERVLLSSAFIGRLLTSACETVLAICVRAVSSTGASPVTFTLVSIAPSLSEIGRSNAEPTVSTSDLVMSAKP